MNCARCRELLSDHLEGALAAPLERDLDDHLVSCSECRELRALLSEVVATLSSPSLPEPPEDLTERILARTLPHLRHRSAHSSRDTVLLVSGWPAAASWLAAAAVFVLVLLWRPPALLSDWSREASRTARQAYSFGVRTASDAQRFLAELNVLRMTVGVAFEDRIDRLNERLQALDEARRRTDGEVDSKKDPDSSSRERRDAPLASCTPTDQRSLS